MTDQSQFNATAHRQYVSATSGHVSLGKGLRFIVFIALLIPVGLILYHMYRSGTLTQGGAIFIGILCVITWKLISGGIRVAAQWERGVVLRLGKFQCVKGPGTFYIVPIFEYVRFVDTRTLVVNIPRQKVITQDNVPAEIDGALFFLVENPEKAITLVQDFLFAITQYAQAALRDVVGVLTLDQLLTEREQIQLRIGEHIEAHIRNWGIHVDSIRLQDIELPEDLKRMMSRQASAEREKRATITKSEGDKLAAQNLAAAAEIMQTRRGAMQLRTLQTIDGLGAGPSNTIVLFPAEIINLTRSQAPTEVVKPDVKKSAAP